MATARSRQCQYAFFSVFAPCLSNEWVDAWMDGWMSLLHRDFSAGSPKTECHSNLCFTRTDGRSCRGLACCWNRKCPVGARLPGACEVIPDFTQLDFGAYSRGWLVPHGWLKIKIYLFCFIHFFLSPVGLRMTSSTAHQRLLWSRKGDEAGRCYTFFYWKHLY